MFCTLERISGWIGVIGRLPFSLWKWLATTLVSSEKNKTGIENVTDGGEGGGVTES